MELVYQKIFGREYYRDFEKYLPYSTMEYDRPPQILKPYKRLSSFYDPAKNTLFEKRWTSSNNLLSSGTFYADGLCIPSKSISGHTTLFEYDYAGAGFRVYITNSNLLLGFQLYVGGTQYSKYSTEKFLLGKLNHYAFSYDGTKMECWINGVYKNLFSLAGTAGTMDFYSSYHFLRISNPGGINQFDGEHLQVRLFDTPTPKLNTENISRKKAIIFSENI